MTRDRALAGIVLLIAAAIIVVVFSRHSSTRTVERTQTTPGIVVVQSPAAEPLRDSIREPKRKRRSGPAKKAKGRSGQTIQSAPPASGTPKSPTRTGTKRRATAGTPKRSTGAQGQPSSTPPPSPQPQPQQQPHPQPGITVPLPSVCLPPVTCP